MRERKCKARKNIFIFLNHGYLKDAALIGNAGFYGTFSQARSILVLIDLI